MSRRDRQADEHYEPIPRGEKYEITTLTSKQMTIMELVLRGNGTTPDGAFIPIDLDQLLERLPYETTKQSMQFSIRALINREMLERGPRENRRGRSRVTLKPTKLAQQQLRLGIAPNWLADAPPKGRGGRGGGGAGGGYAAAGDGCDLSSFVDNDSEG
jgi:hypothetical protein